MSHPDLNFTAPPRQLIANQFGKKYDSFYPNGDAPVYLSYTVLKKEDFSSGTIPTASIGTLDGTQDAVGIVNYGIGYLLRANLSTGGADPLTGKIRDGWHTHWFKSNSFVTKADGLHIAYAQRYKFDDCWWNTSSTDAIPNTYPKISGKWFWRDATWGTGAMYFGLTDGRLVAGNTSDAPESPFNQDAQGNAAWVNRAYGWRNSAGQVVNNLRFDYSALGAEYSSLAFASDNKFRELAIEVKYNPDSIGHNKARIIVNGCIIHASSSMQAGTTDANGWFNLPGEFELVGAQVYANNIDNGNAQDSVSNPGTYTGYSCGLEIQYYSISQKVA